MTVMVLTHPVVAKIWVHSGECLFTFFESPDFVSESG